MSRAVDLEERGMHFVWNIELASNVCSSVGGGEGSLPAHHLFNTNLWNNKSVSSSYYVVILDLRIGGEIPSNTVHRVGTGIRCRGKEKQCQAIIFSKRGVNLTEATLFVVQDTRQPPLWIAGMGLAVLRGGISVQSHSLSDSQAHRYSFTPCPLLASPPFVPLYTHLPLTSCLPPTSRFRGFWSEVASA